jgi:N utilization substance protein B
MQILCTLERQPELSVGQATALYYSHLLGDDGASTTSDDGKSTPGEQKLFVETLVSGVRRAQSEIDALIGRCSRNWRLPRMAVPDRNVLRLACFELMFCPEVPARAVLNEAIEIARRYGASESASFVNGVLDRLVEELGRRDEPTKPETPPATAIA